MLLILLLVVSWKSFSQKDTIVPLPKPIAKLVIKDLIQGDGAIQELNLLNDKFNILQQKSTLQDSIIHKLDSLNQNHKSIIDLKSTQLNISQELNLKLQTDLKKQKFKTKIISGVGLASILGVLLILK